MGMFDDLIPQGNPSGDARSQIGQPEELSLGEKLMSGVQFPKWVENLRGTAPVRVLQGMADPMIGGMQTVANLLPDSTGIPQAVNKRVGDLETDYQSQRRAMADPSLTSLVTGKQDLGTDWARLAGNVTSPVNLAIAAKAPLAVGALARAGQGAAIGTGTAAMEPVADTSGGFWGTKGAQIATGAAGGAILTPILGKIGDIAVRRLATAGNAARSAAATDAAINDALQDLGQTIHDVPPAQLQALREQVNSALDKGRSLDPAAAMRKADFQALDMEPTLGQVTRDPMQFAREQNLRGVENVGEPLSARFQDQGTKLVRRLTDPAAGAKDGYNAGTQLVDSLKSTDDVLRRHVSGLYGDARASAGKDLEVPLEGLAQDYAQVLTDFGDKVPSAIRSKFAALGLDPANPSNQKQLFTLENANALLQNINEHVGADRPTNTALAKLRDAVKSAVTGADASGGPFAPAVQAASERFKLQDAVPALKAAAQGDVAPDDFVRRFIINGKTNDVKGLAQVLQQADPAAHQEARAQLADELRRAAFGENAGQDAPFAPTRYMATIRRIGVDKLSAFFSPEEVADFMRVGRVGSYIKQAPNASAVNTSNTSSAAMNLLARVPGMGPVAAVGNKVASTVQNNSTVRNALAAQLDTTKAPLSDVQRNYLAYLLSLGGAQAGSLAGRAVGQ